MHRPGFSRGAALSIHLHYPPPPSTIFHQLYHLHHLPPTSTTSYQVRELAEWSAALSLTRLSAGTATLLVDQVIAAAGRGFVSQALTLTPTPTPSPSPSPSSPPSFPLSPSSSPGDRGGGGPRLLLDVQVLRPTGLSPLDVQRGHRAALAGRARQPAAVRARDGARAAQRHGRPRQLGLLTAWPGRHSWS